MHFITHGVRLSDQPLGGHSLPMPVVFEAAPPQRWEYHVVTIDPREENPLAEDRLAALGQDGWLLAGILHFPTAATPTRITYYFVRSVA